MNDAHVGPIALWEFFQPSDHGIGVIGEKQTQAARNTDRIVGRAPLIVRNPPDEQGRSRLRSVMRFHRRQFGRLQPAHDAGAVVSAENLERDADARDRQRNPQRAAMKKIVLVASQKERMDCRHCEARRHKCRKRHMHDFMKAGRIQHGRDRVKIGELAVNHFEARGSVHPRIGRHHENTGENPADRNDQSRKPVHQWREVVPAIEIDADKNRFAEKGETFQGKGHADNRPGLCHEARP